MDCPICGTLCDSLYDTVFTCRGLSPNHYFFRDTKYHTRLRIDDVCIEVHHYSQYTEFWRGTGFTATRHKSRVRIDGALDINPQNFLEIKRKLNTYLLFS